VGRDPDPLVSRNGESGPTAGIVLDEVQPGDLDRILGIEEASFPQPWSRRSFARELELAFSRTLVARAPAGVVGYVCRWRLEDEIQILNVAVAPEARRCGIARMLVVAVLHEATEAGLPVSLEVATDNPGAIALYEALGFVARGERKDFYGRGRNGRTMIRAAAT
jgi:ribosomal-protein-alanine N-acetyltransferase